MENYMIVGLDDKVKIFMALNVVENLKAYKPKGCPFEGYSMFDLLMDWVKMYSWQVGWKIKISLIDFVKYIHGDGKVAVYSDSMIGLLSE